jgi:hydrogenase maturation protein HypF
MELEALAGDRRGEELPVRVIGDDEGGRAVLDPVPLLAALGRRAIAGEDLGALAATLHESIAAAAAVTARQATDASGVTTVVLGGGVFQNARLLASLRRRLEAMSLTVLAPRLLPANDGAISYGQAAVAAARLAAATH